MSLERVVKAIAKQNRFLITTHVNPEGDALGSELTVKVILDKLGKSSNIINEKEPPREYKFLPGINSIKKFRDLKDFDAAIVLDCSDLGRTGKVSKLVTKDKSVINIDHHISNSYFGKVNWVDSGSSSACEMVYRLYKALKIKLNRNSALNMYVGILTDTGSFRYSNTTALTHKVVSDLLREKISVSKIYRKVYQSYSFSDMKFLASQISDFNIDKKGKIVWASISHKTLVLNKTSMDLADSILNFARAIKGVEVVLLFKAISSNEVRVNLRSNGKVDVNRLAKIFGGGGHKTASGFTIKGDLRDVEARVLREVKTAVY